MITPDSLTNLAICVEACQRIFMVVEGLMSVLYSQVIQSSVLYNFDPIGLIYLPEIKYRRILNQAFGPGGWAIMPRGETLNFQVRTHFNTFAVHVMLVYILTTSTGESCL